MQTLICDAASDCSHRVHQTQALTPQVKSNSIKGLCCNHAPTHNFHFHTHRQTSIETQCTWIYTTPVSVKAHQYLPAQIFSEEKNINRSFHSAHFHALIELCSNILMVLNVSWCMFTMMYQSNSSFHMIEAKADNRQVKTSIQISCLQACKEVVTTMKKQITKLSTIFSRAGRPQWRGS